MDQSNLITEFFYDGISRLVPGLIVVAIYGHRLIETAFCKMNGASAMLSICVFLAAWLVGALIEMLTFVPFEFMLTNFQLRFPRNNFLLNLKKEHLPIRVLVIKNAEDKPYERQLRRQVYKLFAETRMFRCLFFISVLIYTFHQNIEWKTSYSDYCVISAYIFAFGWLHMRTNTPRDTEGNELLTNEV